MMISKKYKSLVSQILFAPFLATLALGASNLLASETAAVNPEILNLKKHLKPIRLLSDQMSDLHGSAIADLRVFSVSKASDTLAVIPAQWAQLNEEGGVYNPVFKVKTKGDVETLDAHDQLELMYADAGDAPCEKVIEETGLDGMSFEIQPDDQTARRWICVAVAPEKPMPTTDYIEYDEDTGQAHSENFRLQLNKENPLIWNDFFYKGVNYDSDARKASGPSILDSLKINIAAGIFTNFTKLNLDNSNLGSDILAIEKGPIRDTLFAKTKVKVAGVRVFSMDVMMHLYPQHVEMVTRFKIPSAAKAVIRNPKVDVSLDANNQWGSKILTSWGNRVPLEVNGKLEPEEIALTEQEVASEDTWIWYSTQKGFDLFTYIDFDEGFDVPIALVYEDDKNKEIKPERFPGQGPNVGYSIRGMVIGKYFTFNTHLLFADQVKDQDVPSMAKGLRKPWQVL